MPYKVRVNTMNNHRANAGANVMVSGDKLCTAHTENIDFSAN